MYNIVETLVCIMAVNNGNLEILLKKKSEEPYKGYWILPGDILSKEENLEQCARRIITNTINLECLFLMQGKMFSDINRNPNDRIIAATFTTITNKNIVDLKNRSECDWFSVKELPKLAYDHSSVIMSNIKKLNHKILKNEDEILFKFFPSDFTLTEFQSFFENVIDKKLDRRNFRKKILRDDVVISTGIKSIGQTGRPAELFKLNESLKEANIL